MALNVQTRCMEKLMSKNWLFGKVMMPLTGLLVLFLSVGWINIFSQLMFSSVDLPVPTVMISIDLIKTSEQNQESSVLVNHIASFSDNDTTIDLHSKVSLGFIPHVKVPSVYTESYSLPIFASEFLLSIPSLLASVHDHSKELIHNYNFEDAKAINKESYMEASFKKDLPSPQFKIPSHYASFFSVTIMQDRSPPAISLKSMKSFSEHSPKPRLRPNNSAPETFVSLGYFTQETNLIRALNSIEMTGYPYQKTQANLLGKSGYLFKLGPFYTKEDAEKALEISKIIGFEDAYKIN